MEDHHRVIFYKGIINMAGPATTIEVTARERMVLEALTRATSTPQQLADRCRVVLMSAEGRANLHQAAVLEVDRQRVRRWRDLWARAQERLGAAEDEGANDKDLHAMIVSVLSDEERSGVPPKFSPEQVARDHRAGV